MPYFIKFCCYVSLLPKINPHRLLVNDGCLEEKKRTVLNIEKCFKKSQILIFVQIYVICDNFFYVLFLIINLSINTNSKRIFVPLPH